METFDKLVEKAIRVLNENQGFNEIELSDGPNLSSEFAQ